MRKKRVGIYESRNKRNHGENEKSKQLIGILKYRELEDLIFEDTTAGSVLESKKTDLIHHFCGSQSHLSVAGAPAAATDFA